MSRPSSMRFPAVLAVLLIAAPATADGGISAIGALLDLLLWFIGIVGLVIIGLMYAANASLLRNDRVSVGAGFCAALAIFYVMIAALFGLAGTESSWFWIPVVMGIIVITRLVRFFRLLRSFS